MPGAVKPHLLRLVDAAIYLGVSVSTIYNLIDRGTLQPLTLPGLRGPRLRVEDLDALIARGTDERNTAPRSRPRPA